MLFIYTYTESAFFGTSSHLCQPPLPSALICIVSSHLYGFYLYFSVSTTELLAELIQYYFPIVMSRRCTACIQVFEFSFFQPRIPTTEENKLLRTCFGCREKNRNRRSNRTQQRRSALTELNPNNSRPVIPVRRSQDNQDENLPTRSVRQRRLSTSSNTSFQHEYGFAVH